MSVLDEVAVRDRPYLQWGPVLAGAAGASAIWWTLMAFGSAVGLSMTSAWPGERASGTTMAIVATLWTLLVHVTAYGAGGYIAGRMRAPTTDFPSDERTFRDGAHGFVVWAVAVLAAGYILATVVGGVGAAATQTLSSVAGG
ncbi:MAG: hypothetical protein JWN93_908, partial [Hyphomicrobiales bacterium]|nr:hypothetical protein [Hyphomicrobiales bacterium]